MKFEDYTTEAKVKVKKECDNCNYLLRKDDGYSDYTVENTEYHCLKKAPYSKKELWGYEEISVENNCKSFKKGAGIHINVEFSKDDFIAMGKDEAFNLAEKQGLLPYNLEDLV